MSKKNIRKHGRRKEFSTDISSLDEIPSTNTSSNDATGIESVGVKAEAADITGAELGGVNTEITEKTAAADSAEELPTAVNSCNRQSKCVWAYTDTYQSCAQSPRKVQKN